MSAVGGVWKANGAMRVRKTAREKTEKRMKRRTKPQRHNRG